MGLCLAKPTAARRLDHEDVAGVHLGRVGADERLGEPPAVTRKSEVLKCRTPTKYAAMKASSSVANTFNVVCAFSNIPLG